MILKLKQNVSEKEINETAIRLSAIVVKEGNSTLLVTPSKLKSPDDLSAGITDSYFSFEDDIQLASRKFLTETRKIDFGNVSIGGATNNTIVIAGPCSVESEAQINQSADLIHSLGIKFLRAGAFKPRTSPYTFQGLGIEGLKLLAKMREKHGLKIVTEVKDSTHLEAVIEYTDVIQIGAKAMYDHGILRGSAKSGKAVLLKRGFGTTLQEFVQAAEFILSGGNSNLMLCERGIRTFETKTRFTLDLCGVAYLKQYTNLPVVLDPSHAMGYAYGVADLARACTAMGVDGLLIETHPDPSVAKSDASQQLNHDEFRALYKSLIPVAAAIGRKIV